MNNKSDRRDFDRFPIEFEIEVAAQDSEGKKYSENTILRNISGGGARFITQQASKYFTGQPLEVTVFFDWYRQGKGPHERKGNGCPDRCIHQFRHWRKNPKNGHSR